MTDRDGEAKTATYSGRIGGYARWIVRLRWVLVAFWIVAIALTVWLKPGPASTGGNLSGLLPADSPAVQTEVRAQRLFGLPLLTRVAIVQRDPNGLSPQVQVRALARAIHVARGQYQDAAPIVAAVPVPNTVKLFPGSREDGTTIVTYLFIPPSVSFDDQLDAGRRLVEEHFDPADHVIGVTGSIPARAEQSRLLERSLSVEEAATVAAIFLIVAIAFRSLVAPLVTIAVAGAAIVFTLNVAGVVASILEVSLPPEAQPLLVALLLGIVTDYAVFYLSAVRHELRSGLTRRSAGERGTARVTPMIVTAALTVAAGTGAMIVARSEIFRAFGPAMALAVIIGAVVAVTLLPALLALLGRAAFWPHRPVAPPTPRADGGDGRPGTWWSRWLSRRRNAAIVLVACVAGLAVAALPLRHAGLGLSFVSSLPAENSVRAAATQAEAGFAAGILAPTELLVEKRGIASQRAELGRVQEMLAAQPGVAGVLGPADQVLPENFGLFLAPDGNAVRYLLILSHRPAGARAVETVTRLRADLPEIMASAGVHDARVGLAGDTAITKELVDMAAGDLGRIATAALAVNLLILVLYLRALVAPAFLLASSVLTIAATLGLTTLVFPSTVGDDGFSFYVPFAVAVLLLALGSDYNIFGVGQVWEEARSHPLRRALAIAIPRSAQAIRTAGITLAVSFGLLAVVPLRSFREVAFAMSVGILMDALFVRSLMVPSLLSLLGTVSGWPGHRLRGPRHGARPAPGGSHPLPD